MLLVIDSAGKLTGVSPNGTGTAVCPSLALGDAGLPASAMSDWQPSDRRDGRQPVYNWIGL